MNKPSKNWKSLRQAVLERVQRTAIVPLEPLYTIYACVCLCYLAGFIRFQFFDHPTNFTWIEVVQLAIVVVSGALIPLLTGSVLTLHFANRKLQLLVRE